VKYDELRTLPAPMKPSTWMPAARKEMIARTHGANEGVAAPTTARDEMCT
jgi:hypothetical protein